MIELELFEISKIDSLRLIHLVTCLSGAVFLFCLWNDARIKNTEITADLGIIFVIIALILWAVMDFYRFMGLMIAGQVSVVIKTFSAYNNAFFIATLPFFKYVFRSFKNKYPWFANGKNWALSVFLVNIFIVMFYTLSWGEHTPNSDIVKHFDVFYSVVTFGGLGYAISQTFFRQRKKRVLLGWISIFVTLLLIAPQITFSPFFNVNHFDVISILLFASHISLIMLLVILANDWIYEMEQQAEELRKEEMAVALFSAQTVMNQTAEKLAEYEKENKILKEQLENNDQLIKDQEVSLDLAELSDRELSVLSLINKSYTEIAGALFIAKETVISHKKNIEAKLRISGKDKLEEFAIKAGLIDKLQ